MFESLTLSRKRFFRYIYIKLHWLNQVLTFANILDFFFLLKVFVEQFSEVFCDLGDSALILHLIEILQSRGKVIKTSFYREGTPTFPNSFPFIWWEYFKCASPCTADWHYVTLRSHVAMWVMVTKICFMSNPVKIRAAYWCFWISGFPLCVCQRWSLT